MSLGAIRCPVALLAGAKDHITPPEQVFALADHVGADPADVTTRLVSGRHLGCFLFQLPPNFARDMERLGDLLAQLPPDLRVAFEFRHASWLAEDVYAQLRAANAALVIADSAESSTPLVATADWEARWRDTLVYFKHEESGTGPAFARALAELLARNP